MRAGSLFSGIGGLDLAVEAVTRARTVWQVERDAWCRSVLAKHWPEARRYDDVRAVGEELERVDIIAGGFPCQDLSHAGKRAGLAGERSGLWREFARIIRVVGPRFVFVENVSGLLSDSGAMGAVLGDLAAMGFNAEWGVFRASDVGAPHRRERVFILAVVHAAGPRREGGAGAWSAGGGGISSITRRTGVGLADADGGTAQRDESLGLAERSGAPRPRTRGAAGVGVGLADPNGEHGEERDGTAERSGTQHAVGRSRSGRDGIGAAEPRVGGDAHGLSARLAQHRWPAGRGEAQHEWEPPRVAEGVVGRARQLRALGNAVVPQQAALALTVLAERLGVASVMGAVS